MHDADARLKKLFSLRNLLIPVLLGAGAGLFLVLRNFDKEALKAVEWNSQNYLWFAVIIGLIMLRQLAYMYRIRLLTEGSLTWKRSFYVISLWEFASAVTPTVVGGSAVAVYIINREHISAGRSTAIVLVTAFLDELFFVLMVPLLVLWGGYHQIFGFAAGAGQFQSGVFWMGYIIIVGLTASMGLGIFVRPQVVAGLLKALGNLRFLKKWKEGFAGAAQDIETTAIELSDKNLWFWVKAFVATLLTWSARFLVVNVLILIFAGACNHLIVYARHLMIWVLLLVTPTPGGSGVAELIFSYYLGDIVPSGLAHPMAIVWRVVTYYPYILLGLVVLPLWLRSLNATQPTKPSHLQGSEHSPL
ncbi:MAG: lysylphosphatidylglycerol synthase transmembrane domain-containing protein [Bacteroidales bacterium]